MKKSKGFTVGDIVSFTPWDELFLVIEIFRWSPSLGIEILEEQAFVKILSMGGHVISPWVNVRDVQLASTQNPEGEIGA